MSKKSLIQNTLQNRRDNTQRIDLVKRQLNDLAQADHKARHEKKIDSFSKKK